MQAKPTAGRQGGHLPAVVGLGRADRDQGFRAVGLRFGQQKFQLAGFIAAKSQAGLVIALDPQARAAQGRAQARHGFDRGR